MMRLVKLPFWPARMTAPVAAAYMGVSHTTFLDRFGDKGVKEGGNVLWAKVQLDRFIDQQFGIEGAAVVSDEPENVDNAYREWKRAHGKG